MSYFDEVAGKWDSPRRIARAEALAAVITDCLGGKTTPQTALEFGCGTGLLSYELCAVFDEIYGYDPSAEMLRIFTQKKEALHAGNVHPLPSLVGCESGFDCIFSSMVLHHVADTAQALASFAALLAPRGVLLLIDLDGEDGTFHSTEPDFHGHNGFDRTLLAQAARGCGFTHVNVRDAYHGAKEIAGVPVPYSLFCLHGEKA